VQTNSRSGGFTGLIIRGRQPIEFRWYLFLLAFLVLPNLPLLLAARPLNLLPNGYVDLDYLLIGLLSLFVPGAVTFVLLLATIWIDFIHATCVTYFLTPIEYFYVSLYAGQLSTTRLGLIVAALGSAVLICLACVGCTSHRLRGRQRWPAAAIMLVPLLLLTMVDLLGARGIVPASGSVGSSTGLTRTPILSLLHSQAMYERYERALNLGGQGAMPSATSIAFHRLRDYPRGGSPAIQGAQQDTRANLVLVLVESWGLAGDLSLRRAMVEPYSDPALRATYDVVQGTIPFLGSTTSGEERELCQAHFGAYVADVTATQLQHCLPLRLRTMGYRTLAVHGFSGEMYDRNKWYPEMGFEDVWFHDRLEAAGVPDCDGTFRGSCDAAVASWIASRLRPPEETPLFLHWVTLNSHLPIGRLPVMQSPRSCDISAITREDSKVCSWYQLISVVHESVRDLALKPLGRSTIFVIVGDHAPPFGKGDERAQFSSREVPYVILLPKMATSP
jgi:Sulfatase